MQPCVTPDLKFVIYLCGLFFSILLCSLSGRAVLVPFNDVPGSVRRLFRALLILDRLILLIVAGVGLGEDACVAEPDVRED